ncbi:glycosyltransferase family 4 protein [Evansella sp. AB-rgal1]|uniref:glycosyltransferase family 4 protein n=1 Tax=Evansella sp. AB-rgal1 TaxID=3242696 RepID=UPI00359E6A4A
MRIAIFSDTYAPEINGVARTLKRYTDYLDKSGIEYRLFVPESSTPIPPVPQVQRFTSVPFILYPECRIALPNPLHIKETLKEFNPTLIHITTPFNLGLFGLHYGRKHNIPMVASYHTNFDDYLGYYHLLFMEKWIWKYMTWFHSFFQKVYVPSQSTKEKLLKYKVHQNIEIWGRGVNNTYFSPLKRTVTMKEKLGIKEKNVLLYVGRIAPEKDVRIAVDTFHNLPKESKKDTHLLIVGDGPQRKALSAKIEKQITYTGFMEGEELAEVYASSDVFLFPSPTETFGNVVLEAQASGLPVVGAKSGGVQHLVDNERDGFLCEEKNVDDFVKYTNILLENKKLRQTFSVRARESAVGKSWDNIFEKLVISMRNVIERRSRHSA